MPYPRHRIPVLVTLAVALAACGERERMDCGEGLPAITPGFGAPGPHAMERRSARNPHWPSAAVSVFLPAGVTTAVPVLLLAHAYNEGDPERYRALIEHLVGRGNAVVFPSYVIEARNHADRLDALWSGFSAGLEAAGPRIDLERMGFLGHSYGAGAVPALALRALTERRWGSRGSFLLMMAPWFAVEIEPEVLADFPRHAKLLVLVFEDDTANDHRIAIELFDSIGVPAAEKDYLMVRSETHAGCPLPAVHTVPLSHGLRAADDALDVFGVFRLVDALAAYAFEGDPAGRRVALGQGSDEQIDMGAWPDGAPRHPLHWSMPPRAAQPQSFYIFRFNEKAGWQSYEGPASP